LNPLQRCNETALLSVHDHIIKAMSHKQVTCLTLLDFSAAFVTIDHSILLERLSSWFGISSTALSWIKSYILNRSFYVNIENSKSSIIFQLLYGVPKINERIKYKVLILTYKSLITLNRLSLLS